MNLTKKQKSAFKKICSVHGPKYVRDTLKNGKKEQRDFILQIARLQGVWWTPNYLECADVDEEPLLNVNLPTLISAFFDIPESWYDRSRGQNQKLTYRTNRLNHAFNDWSNRDLFTTHLIGEKLLFSFDVSNLSGLFDYRGSRWFTPAKSMDEAIAVFETMVLIPLGHSDQSRRHRNDWDARCHGLAKWFNYEPANSKVIAMVSENFMKKKHELTEQLQALETEKKEADMKLAILSQFRMFVSDETTA